MLSSVDGICILSLTLIFLLTLTLTVDGYPDGAPDDACGTLYPTGHGGVPFQTSPGGYSIFVNSSTVESGVSFTVTVRSDSINKKFRGFMLSAVDNYAKTVTAGSFTITDSTYSQLNCLGYGGSVTHTLNAGITIDSVSVTYNAPVTPGFDHIIFNATVVHDLATFYSLAPVILHEVTNKPPSAPSSLSLYSGSVLVVNSTNVSSSSSSLSSSSSSSSSAVLNNLVFSIGPSSSGSAVIDLIYIEVDSSGTGVGDKFHVIYSGSGSGLGLGVFANFTMPAYKDRIILARARSHNQVGNSPYSPIITFHTALDNTPPPQPPNTLTFTDIKQTALNIRWTPTLDANGLEIMYYVLEQKNTSSPDWFTICSHCVSTSFSLSGLSHSTIYNFRVSSVTLAGRSAPAANQTSTMGCLNNCSGKGTCSPTGTCQCAAGYLRTDCSVAATMPLTCVTPHFCLHWSLSDDSSSVYFRVVSLGITGWFALGLGASDGMTGMNVFRFIIGGPNQIFVADLHAAGFTTPIPDVIQDIDPTEVVAFLNDTHADVSFTRKRKTIDPQDIVLSNVKGDVVPASFAYGPYAFYQHDADACGRFTVDIGGLTVTPQAPLSFNFYVPIIALLVVIAVFSLLFNVVPFLRRSSLVQSRLTSTACPSSSTDCSASSFLDACTLNFRQTFSDLTYVEAIVLILYAAALTVSILLGRRAYSDFGKDPNAYVVGHLASVHLAAGLLPVTRNSLVALWMGSSFERLVKYHRWIMRAAVLFLWLHLFLMLSVFGSSKYLENVTLPYGDSAVSGFISFVFLNTMVLFSIDFVRRHFYHLFFITHLVFFPISIVMAMLHSIYFRYYVIAPIALYGLDMLVRLTRGHLMSTQLVRAALLPTGTKGKSLSMLQLQMKKFKYEAGQYVFINVPDIALTEWHPFTISSSPSTPGAPFTLHILDMGKNTFTQKLAQLVANKAKSNTLVDTDRKVSVQNESSSPSSSSSSSLLPSNADFSSFAVKLDGPYGKPSVTFNDYRVLILVAGGVGITPLISIATDIMNAKMSPSNDDDRYSNIGDVHLVWTVRHTDAITHWFPSQLAALSSTACFHVHLYVTNSTRSVETDEEAGFQYKTMDDEIINATKPLPQEEGNPTIDQTAQVVHSTIGADDDKLIAFSHSPSPGAVSGSGHSVHSSLLFHRPDFHVLFDKIIRSSSPSVKAAVLTCGPDTMVAKVHEAAVSRGIALAKETFLL